MKLIYLRKATIKDLNPIWNIIQNGKQYLKQQGIDQWQDHYPTKTICTQDIYAGVSYVLIYNHQIAGVTSIIYGLDPTYLEIDGHWKNGIKAHYATLHRVAVSNNFRGAHLSDFLFSNVISQVLSTGCRDIRMDTHPDNKIMQHIATDHGFKKTGIIQTEHPGQKATNRDRFAYQLTF